MNKNQCLVGGYVEEIRDALIASAVSRVGVYLLGAPGGGKSACAKAFGRQMYGKRGKDWCFIEFSPATQEQRVEGVLDYQAWFKDSKYSLVKTGTPSDPGIGMVVADEMSRANESIHDLFMTTMDEWELEHRGTQLIATGNFLPTGDRAEAFLDRIGLYIWLGENGYDVKDVSRAQMRAQHDDLDLPNFPITMWKEVEDARKATPTEKAVEAVAEFVGLLSETAVKGLQDTSGSIVRQYPYPNKRRITTWTRILDKATTLYSGTADFDQVHPMAIKALQYSWVLKSQEEARDWRSIISLIADPTQAAVDAVMAVAYQAVKQAADSASERIGKVEAMQKELNQALANVASIPGVTMDSPIYRQCNADLVAALGQYIRKDEGKGVE